jgi:dTDP-4-amino-4,6-dideoxygalactose transaminase
MSRNIPLFKVFMPESVIEPLREVLLSGFLTQGPRVDVFENQLRSKLKVDSLVTVNSGTSAIHLALRLIGIGPGDEVLTSPLTCTATNWPILLSGADIKWCDAEKQTCNIDPADVERKISEKTSAIIAVHWGGYPCNLDSLKDIADSYGIPIIEDCAHSFGGSYKEVPIGASGNYCAFSFQAIKHLTTVDGGCLTFPRDKLERAKLLRWYGIDREGSRTDFRCENDIPEIGDKLHMNDVAATIGIEQLKYVDSIVSSHKDNAQFYFKELSDIDGISLPENKYDGAFWLFTIRVSRRDDFLRAMKDKGISTSKVHERNDKHSCVAKYKTSLPSIDFLAENMVCIPVGWWVTSEDRQYIVDCIKEGW